eukprot:scaffold9686_cov54-Attheya_sp.AAC.2
MLNRWWFFLLASVPLVNGFSGPSSSSSSGTVVQRNEFVRSIVMGGPVVAFLATAAVDPANAAVLDLGVYQDGPRGIRYLVTQKPPASATTTVVKPERATQVKASYTLYLGGFPKEPVAEGRMVTKIDSSKGPFGEKPFEFFAGVGEVIKGWDLSILDMQQGEARRLIIPSDLAYGDKGAAGGKIPGKSTLYFDVELVEIGKRAIISPEQQTWLDEHPL